MLFTMNLQLHAHKKGVGSTQRERTVSLFLPATSFTDSAALIFIREPMWASAEMTLCLQR